MGHSGLYFGIPCIATHTYSFKYYLISKALIFNINNVIVYIDKHCKFQYQKITCFVMIKENSD